MLCYDGKYIKETNKITDRYKKNISEANQKKFQAFELIMQNNVNIKIANFHGEFRNQEGTCQDINFLIREGFIIVGDFNLKKDIKTIGDSLKIWTDRQLMPTSTLDAIYYGRQSVLNFNQPACRSKNKIKL
jgi:hypothetical protein